MTKATHVFIGREFGLTDTHIHDFEMQQLNRIEEASFAISNSEDPHIRDYGMMVIRNSEQVLDRLASQGSKQVLRELRELYIAGHIFEMLGFGPVDALDFVAAPNEDVLAIYESDAIRRPRIMAYSALMQMTDWGTDFVRQVGNYAFYTKSKVGS